MTAPCVAPPPETYQTGVLMRVAVVVKQVPAFAEMALDADGRLIRAGLPLELNPYCRRAVSQAVELTADASAGSPAPPVAARAPQGLQRNRWRSGQGRARPDTRP